MWEPGQPKPPSVNLPCGATAVFDTDSGMGHRCTSCFAMLGSVGMNKECADLLEEHGVKERGRATKSWKDL